jgi:tetratricopeptide (TPR) repeat protein
MVRQNKIAQRNRRKRTDSSRAPLPTGRPSIAVCIAALIVTGTLVYANSLSNPFHYDDDVSVVQNRQIRQLSTALSPPAGGEPVAGRPLVNLTFALNYAVNGLSVRGYHVVNVALHIVCALLLFAIVRRTLVLSPLQSGAPHQFNRMALASAMIWTLHPLNTQTVNYVSARTESLMAMFFLVTLYCSIRAADERRGFWSIGAVASCALGMTCKESMITAPVAVLLYDRAYRFGSVAEALQKRRHLYIGLAATVPILVWLIWSGPRSDSAGFFTGITPWSYLLNQSIIITQYLSATIWPRALIFDYGEPLTLTPLDVAPQFVLITGLAVAAVVVWFLRPRIGFLALWFFVTLAPTSSIVPVATEVGADRRMYLPLAGLVVMTVVLIYEWRARSLTSASGSGVRRSWSGEMGIGVGVIVLCVALGVLTVRRNTEYASGLTLWQSALDRWPSARAHRNLATYLRAAGRREEALVHLRESSRDHPEAKLAVGYELFELGRLDEAVVELESLAREFPSNTAVPQARALLGRIFISQRRLPQAAEQFKLILNSDPDDPVAHGGLADALRLDGDLAGAETHYRALLRLQPRNLDAWNYLGAIQANSDRVEEASNAFRRAIELDANNGFAHLHLANLLAGERRFDEAFKHAEAAVRALPRDPAAHHVMAITLLGQDKLDEGIVQLREALALDGANPEIKDHLAAALRLKGGSSP